MIDRVNGALRGESIGMDDIPAVNEFELKAERQGR